MKFAEHIDSFQQEDPNFLTYHCERYRVGTDRPVTYVLKRKSSVNAHKAGNIAGFEVHKQAIDGSMTLINLADQKEWLVKALNQARQPIVNAQLRKKSEIRTQAHETRVNSGFYGSNEYRDWARRYRSAH
ncbi:MULTISPECIES: hypothetical protein [unclassified Acinetobacter]|uniref:hypothetical protein n=1 Tax=unclassified Acinetobacter TaxID=196816 RepID=UPI0007D04BDA|nr:hypothetical protein [Acinetobacter sp. SFA]OAL80665.1 hypothetical protein AY607_02945 [Acinetobacter sp. SFA]